MRTNITLLLIFLILVAVLLLIGTCRQPVTEVKENKPPDTTINKVPDTTTPIHQPSLAKEEKPNKDSLKWFEPIVITQSVDTANIIRPYVEAYNDLAAASNSLLGEMHTKRTYDSTYKGTTADARVKFEVYKNKAQNIEVGFSNQTEKVINNYITQPQKGELYYGFGGGYSIGDSTAWLTPASILWRTKKNLVLEADWSLGLKGGQLVKLKVYPFNRRR